MIKRFGEEHVVYRFYETRRVGEVDDDSYVVENGSAPRVDAIVEARGKTWRVARVFRVLDPMPAVHVLLVEE